jgi:hypothetical protein
VSHETTIPETLQTSSQVNGVAPRAVEGEPEELENWDMHLAQTPRRPSGTLLVRLSAAGRGRPFSVPDPASE